MRYLKFVKKKTNKNVLQEKSTKCQNTSVNPANGLRSFRQKLCIQSF